MYRENRLAKREDFSRVYRSGKSAVNRQFVVYYLERPHEGPPRLGVSVSKKLGNAVIRNRLRRMMKEIVRLHLAVVKGSTDLVVIARKPAADMDYAEMEKALLHVLRRASLLERGKA